MNCIGFINLTNTITMLLLLGFFLTSGFIVGASEKGVVQGEVREATVGGLVESAVIELTSENGIKYQARTNKAGRYKLEIPDGRYQVQAWSPNFFSFNRSPISVSKGDNINLNFTLLFYELTEINPTNFGGRLLEKICTCAKQPEEEIIKLSSSTSGENLIFLTYGTHERGEILTRYKGVDVSFGDCERVTNEIFHGRINPDKYIQITITLGKSTIFADEVLYNKNLSELVMRGKVLFEDGQTRLNFNEIKIDLKTGSFKYN